MGVGAGREVAMQVQVHDIKAISVRVTDYPGSDDHPPFTTVEFAGRDESGRDYRTVFFLKGEAVVRQARALEAVSKALEPQPVPPRPCCSYCGGTEHLTESPAGDLCRESARRQASPA